MSTKVMFHAALIMFSIVFGGISEVTGQEINDVMKKIKWQKGPSIANLANIAEIKVPENCAFANESDTKLFMEANENPTSGEELGLIICSPNYWFSIFEFTETGYIKDDEKNSLNADKILAALKEGNNTANEERKKRGWKPVYVTGWHKPPYYNNDNHNLEWTINVEGDGGSYPGINHNSRVLGRKGVMNATLVGRNQTFDQDLSDFNSMLTGFKYKGGNRYEEFVKGDKVAAYGLTGLIVGGATAVAAKSGLLKYLWKILVGVGIAIVAFFRKIFRRR